MTALIPKQTRPLLLGPIPSGKKRDCAKPVASVPRRIGRSSGTGMDSTTWPTPEMNAEPCRSVPPYSASTRRALAAAASETWRRLGEVEWAVPASGTHCRQAKTPNCASQTRDLTSVSRTTNTGETRPATETARARAAAAELSYTGAAVQQEHRQWPI